MRRENYGERTEFGHQRNASMSFVYSQCTLSEPDECRDVSLTSPIRLEVQMKHGHLAWANKEQASKPIDVQGLFGDYWSSKMRELTVPGQHS